jgi:hypothetical protein
MLGEVSARASDPTTYVKDRAAFWESGFLQEQIDQLDLGFLFGVLGSEEVAVVDVLAPVL